MRYVGVGRVVEAVSSANDFMLLTPAGEQPVLDVLQHADRYRPHADDPDGSEYFVRVRWLYTTTPRWRHTVERLKPRFPGSERPSA